MKTKLKKSDLLLIAIIVVVAGIAYLLHAKLGAEAANCVTVKVNGELKGVYSLGEDQEIEINGGTNHLVIRNGKADMKSADCPDQLCVHQKAVSADNESIICLPNKVIVEVDSRDDSELDAVAQ